MVPPYLTPPGDPRPGEPATDRPDLIGGIPAWIARRRGRRPAILHRGSKISYDDLAGQVDRLRRLIQSAGVRPGEHVALALENCPEYIVSYFAVPAAGATLVPVNTFLATPECVAMLNDASCGTLITSSHWIDAHPGVIEGAACVRRIILRDPAGAGATHREGDRTVLHFGDPAPPAPAVQRDPDDPAVIIYTSGTTGVPKGVLLSHRNLIGNARACIAAVGATPKDRILVALPLFHSFTQMVGMLGPVLSGMSIALCEKIDRAELRTALRRTRPTIFPAVPAVFRALAGVDVGLLTRWLNPVRIYISGGAPLDTGTLERFEQVWRRPLCEGYGLSEAGPVVSLNPPAGPRRPGSVGLPIPGVRCRILDDAGREVPAGEAGALWVKGPGVMKGYLNRDEETRHALRDGWLRTGDQARRDEDGYLYILGREKEMLIFRGMNIYPREIESVIESHPAVREAAVVGFPDPARGDVPWAFVTLHGAIDGGEKEIKRLCLERLARYKVPRSIVILDDLPRNATGKVVKTQLRERFTPLAAVSPRGRVDHARQH